MQRADLADFLRRRRLAINPGDAGLPEGPRRRTAGLRREEVAMLAGMSTDYVVRLEQGRSAQPSSQMLTALARALRLSDDERDHLFHLAGHRPPPSGGAEAHARAGLLRMLDLLGGTAAMVVSDLGETLAQNRMSTLLMGDQTALRGDRRYRIWRWFTEPQARFVHPADEEEHHSRSMVADLRATAARRAGDSDVEGLVRRLRAASPEFASLWDEHQVAVRRADRKVIVHRQVGPVQVDCETLMTPDQGQFLLVYTPTPGTDAAEKLALLAVVGLQQFA
ncbi:helix-turn-helix transcriptional regulator [Dactylosporangium sp. AC04546]|uniref:helix-turn-helix transcriptional regulator n=1 Tax=Dactylosporangium sp. AC04546 TaxID=2862460 RepID=UPI001EE11308|nr:helix-turn-helix transcriptional regulator [Dactylosporangium sp. AC04546]WVK78266.1 helix-turn-helix transcriptional regulator [Dactylosporangium sp. AC04546]